MFAVAQFLVLASNHPKQNPGEVRPLRVPLTKKSVFRAVPSRNGLLLLEAHGHDLYDRVWHEYAGFPLAMHRRICYNDYIQISAATATS